MRIMLTRTVLSAALLFLITSGANAATLNVVGGQLLGASGVDVGGTLYNVEFLDGTCIALFSGCDSVIDFMFTTSSEALAASQALLDQVFTDGVSGSFDDDTTLTNGCTHTLVCDAATPYELSGVEKVFVAIAENWSGSLMPGSDSAVLAFSFAVTRYDTLPDDTSVYAVWTPVPEPKTALLLAMGLVGLGWRGRVRQTRHRSVSVELH